MAGVNNRRRFEFALNSIKGGMYEYADVNVITLQQLHRYCLCCIAITLDASTFVINQ